LIYTRRTRVVCFLKADDTQQIETYPLTRDGLTRFTRQLDATDEVAVEATQNIYYFFDQIKRHVAHVAVVDTSTLATRTRILMAVGGLLNGLAWYSLRERYAWGSFFRVWCLILLFVGLFGLQIAKWVISRARGDALSTS
jgi:hypothetical protein